ncbi:hypothetical protein LRZ95_01180 [Candidatus Gracilibacteria bacterium]|nr:hypothetical protein [Candidatus Gracilibacteria bacterium]
MKFLLFFISIVFSFIFYIFYGLSVGKDIFGKDIYNQVNLYSISGNLLIESFIFFLIGIIFLYYFSFFYKEKKELNNNNNNNNNNLEKNIDFNKKNKSILNYKYKILYFIYYIIFVYILYFLNFSLDYILLVGIIIFIFSDILFNHISNIKSLSDKKIKIRVVGLLLNYISSLILIYFLLNNDINLMATFILLFNVVFNFLVHKNFKNYISLLISIFLTVFLFYILYFWLFGLYILYI